MEPYDGRRLLAEVVGKASYAGQFNAAGRIFAPWTLVKCCRRRWLREFNRLHELHLNWLNWLN